jgi:hypothetical protein
MLFLSVGAPLAARAVYRPQRDRGGAVLGLGHPTFPHSPIGDLCCDLDRTNDRSHISVRESSAWVSWIGCLIAAVAGILTDCVCFVGWVTNLTVEVVMQINVNVSLELHVALQGSR